MDLGRLEDTVKKVLDRHLLSYNDTWDKIDDVLTDAMSESFRKNTLDSEGGRLDLQLVLC